MNKDLLIMMLLLVIIILSIINMQKTEKISRMACLSSDVFEELNLMEDK